MLKTFPKWVHLCASIGKSRLVSRVNLHTGINVTGIAMQRLVNLAGDELKKQANAKIAELKLNDVDKALKQAMLIQLMNAL